MTISPITDTIICQVCKGKKVIMNEMTLKNDLCPKCQGENSTSFFQEGKNSRQTLLKG